MIQTPPTPEGEESWTMHKCLIDAAAQAEFNKLYVVDEISPVSKRMWRKMVAMLRKKK